MVITDDISNHDVANSSESLDSRKILNSIVLILLLIIVYLIGLKAFWYSKLCNFQETIKYMLLRLTAFL